MEAQHCVLVLYQLALSSIRGKRFVKAISSSSRMPTELHGT